MDQNVSGGFIFNNINLNYNFTEGFSELDIEPKLPFKVKLLANFITNQNTTESKVLEIKVK